MASATPSVGGVMKTINELYRDIGFGAYQWRLFLICGFGYGSDSIETGLISFLQESAVKEFPDVTGYEINMLSTFVFIGELLGCFMWGPLADRCGRKRAFFISNAFLLTFGLASAASPTYLAFVAVRFIVGLSIGGIVIPVDNLAESVEESRSLHMTFILNYFWTFGTLYVNFVAAAVLDAPWGGWRLLTVLAGVPILLACASYPFFNESPIWLQDQGRDKEALEVMHNIAKANNKTLPEDTALVPYEREEEPSALILLSPALRRRTISLAVIWLTGLLGYYGAALANPYIFEESNGTVDYPVLVFSASGELFGMIVGAIALARLGPMVTMGVFYGMSCVCWLGVLLRGRVSTLVLAVIVFIGRCGCMVGSSVTFAATPLAFPVAVRATAHGLLYGCGRIGALLTTLWPENTSLDVMCTSYSFMLLICAAVCLFEAKLLDKKESPGDSEAVPLTGSEH